AVPWMAGSGEGKEALQTLPLNSLTKAVRTAMLGMDVLAPHEGCDPDEKKEQDADLRARTASRGRARGGQTPAGAPGIRQAVLQWGAVGRAETLAADASRPGLAGGTCHPPYPQTAKASCFRGTARAVRLL